MPKPLFRNGEPLREISVVLFEALREVFDVLRRPARHVHAEVQAHAGQNFLDLVERLATQVGGLEQLVLGALDQVTDCLLYTSPSPRD